MQQWRILFQGVDLEQMKLRCYLLPKELMKKVSTFYEWLARNIEKLPIKKNKYNRHYWPK
jgi:hypothetical protein